MQIADMALQQPLTKETANPNAATAAASAFMRREPSLSLSSAAAAAALKARPTTPTNVAEVQSKRSLRRSASVSSTASRDRGRGSFRELRRTPSNGSMSERTFRSPSPGRSPAPRNIDVPPVPSLPKDAQVRAQRPTSSHKSGATTLQTQPFRTASQKLKDGRQGSWFGGATARDNASARRSDAALQPVPYGDDARSGSISPSINFSYPRASLEYPGSSNVSEQPMVYDANSRRMVPNPELLARSQSVRDASEKPVKKKKSGVSRSGSHFSKGTVGRTQTAPVETSQPSSTQPAREPAQLAPQQALEYRREEPSPTPQPKKELVSHIPTDQPPAEAEPVADEPTRLDLRVADGATVMAPSDAARAPVLDKKPSLVAEESETEEDTDDEEDEPIRQHGAIDAVPVRSSQQLDDVNEKPIRPEQEDVEPKASLEEKLDPLAAEATTQRGSVRRARLHSESPVRSAHFAPTTDRLLVRHEPPPRSLSPRKSAMKHSNSVRGVSPSDDGSEVSAPGVSFNSKDEPSRRKSVRVSFNDESNVVVGESAEPPETESPIVPSPQASKKPWHIILGRHKKDTTTLEDDETMTPRPALPQFGSVREKKPREPDSERPLVRPSERAWSPSLVPSPLPQGGPSNADLEGPSTDSAIGSILSQESSSKNEANISRTREPLPPVVTSIEAIGYDSSSILSTDDDLDCSDIPEVSETVEPSPGVIAEAIQEEQEESEEPEKSELDQGDKTLGLTRAEEPEEQRHGLANANGSASGELAPQPTEGKPDEGIPSISISNPSPLAQEESKISPDREYFDIPGGFPHEASITSTRPEPAADQASEEVPAILSTPRASTSDEPDAPTTPTRSEATMAPASTPMEDITEEGTDESSIYSDAYEDMSDAEAGGFMSLDAVLSAPADTKMSKLYEKTKRQSQERAASAASTASEKDKETREPLNNQDDWENAKAYWRSLSIDKRRQLEKEALEEAGEEADHEADTKQKKKTKKRRSVDRPVSSISTSGAANPDRVYQIQPGTSWAEGAQEDVLKPAQVQAAPVAAPNFQKTMRGERPKEVETNQAQQSSGSMRKTLRSNGTSGDAWAPAPTPIKTTASRPVSYQPPTTVETKNTRRALSSEPRPVSSGGMPSSSFRPFMKRQGSDDSESSFKRSRAGGQGLGFRSSMRESSQEPDSPNTKGTGRFSLRSLSPTGPTFRRSNAAPPPQQSMGGGMRTSMRQSLRTGQSQGKKSSKLGFRRSSGKNDRKDKGSRFADSSDEEVGGGPAFFSSRFADSSDEEDAPMPAPKGGFNKTMRTSKGANLAAAAALGVPPPRAQSPEHPFSDGELVQPKRNTMANGVNGRPSGTLQRSRSGRGTLVSPTAPGVLGTEGVGERPTQQRRGSFMSSILRRKKDNTGRVSRDLSESAARRDTRLERSDEQLSVLRSNSGNKPRLHKREPSWPLPDEETDDEANANVQVSKTANGPLQRPATSAGHGADSFSKPGFLKPRSTSHQGTAIGLPQPEATDPNQKKKFGKLRKMFGLKD